MKLIWSFPPFCKHSLTLRIAVWLVWPEIQLLAKMVSQTESNRVVKKLETVSSSGTILLLYPYHKLL